MYNYLQLETKHKPEIKKMVEYKLRIENSNSSFLVEAWDYSHAKEISKKMETEYGFKIIKIELV